jgi:hypothetical protein
MTYNRLFAIAALVLAASCTESSSMPTDIRPQFGQGGNTGNPAYKSSTYSLLNTFDLNHSWRQTGLGSFTNVPYLLTADADITAHCQNPGGNTVQGAPFHVSQTLSSGPTAFPQRNGAINGSLSLSASAPACTPPGGNPHDAIIDAVTYTNIQFCWGKESISVADLQGPVPPTGTVPPSPQTGTPLTGTQSGSTQGATGIFAACS